LITNSHGSESVVMAMTQINVKSSKFDSLPRQNPLTDLHQNGRAWLRHGRDQSLKIYYGRFKGFCIFPCFDLYWL